MYENYEEEKGTAVTHDKDELNHVNTDQQQVLSEELPEKDSVQSEQKLETNEKDIHKETLVKNQDEGDRKEDVAQEQIAESIEQNHPLEEDNTNQDNEIEINEDYTNENNNIENGQDHTNKNGFSENEEVHNEEEEDKNVDKHDDDNNNNNNNDNSQMGEHETKELHLVQKNNSENEVEHDQAINNNNNISEDHNEQQYDKEVRSDINDIQDHDSQTYHHNKVYSEFSGNDTIVLPVNKYSNEQPAVNPHDNRRPQFKAQPLFSYDRNPNPPVNDDTFDLDNIICPINPRKAHESPLDRATKVTKPLAQHNISVSKPKNTLQSSLPNLQEKSRIYKSQPKYGKNDDDYFFKMFREASNQNKLIKTLTDKVCHVSNVSPECIIGNVPPTFLESKPYIAQRKYIDTSILQNLPVRVDKPKNEPLFILQGREKEEYVQNLKRSLDQFSQRKTESKKNRDDYMSGFDHQLDDIFKKIGKPNNLSDQATRIDQTKPVKNKTQNRYNDDNTQTINNPERDSIRNKTVSFTAEENPTQDTNVKVDFSGKSASINC